MKVTNLIYIGINAADAEAIIDALTIAADKFDIENKFGQSVDSDYSEMLRDLAIELTERMMED